MNIPVLQKHVSQPQSAQEAHAQDTLSYVQVIQGLVITPHSCVTQGKSLVTLGRGFGKGLNSH